MYVVCRSRLPRARSGGPQRGSRIGVRGGFSAALAGDGQCPVPGIEAEVVDVRAGGLGDPQPVQGEQRDQRMLSRRAEPRGDQQRAEFVAVQRDRV
jgi:hypothetical protein